MRSNDRVFSYGVAAGAVGAGGRHGDSAEDDSEKSGDELHIAVVWIWLVKAVDRCRKMKLDDEDEVIEVEDLGLFILEHARCFSQSV